jgi:lipoprotein-anchoring transpeptidase ErfK/SrfK
MRRILTGTLASVLVAAIGAAGALAGPAGSDVSASWKNRLALLPPIARVTVVGSGPIQWPFVGVRSAPDRNAPVIKTMKQFRKDYRPQFVMAREQLTDPETGKPTWYRITVPGRPNGRTGWIPAAAAEIRPIDRWLVVFRGQRKFEFFVRGKLIREGVVAVGRYSMETPLGLFYVQWKFDPTWEVLGAYAFETSGYSKLSDWPGGGVVGVHGTNQPWLLGQAVSHGCVRMANRDIQYLRSVVPVGTPVKIVA